MTHVTADKQQFYEPNDPSFPCNGVAIAGLGLFFLSFSLVSVTIMGITLKIQQYLAEGTQYGFASFVTYQQFPISVVERGLG